MQKSRSVLLLFLAICAAPSHAESQRVPVVGDRVRVRTAGTGESIGTVRSISLQGIEITDANQELSFFLAQSIRTLEVSQGEYLRKGRRGLAMVALVGIPSLTAWFGAAQWSPCTGSSGVLRICVGPESRGTAALIGAVIGFPIGVIFANSLGKDRVSDSWEEAVLPAGTQRATIGLFRGATAGDIGIGVSIPIGGR